jgi:hypothetical protein
MPAEKILSHCVYQARHSLTIVERYKY